MESELRALLTEDPDDADVSKLLAQTTAALEALKAESEPGAAKTPASDGAGSLLGQLPHWAGPERRIRL